MPIRRVKIARSYYNFFDVNDDCNLLTIAVGAAKLSAPMGRVRKGDACEHYASNCEASEMQIWSLTESRKGELREGRSHGSLSGAPPGRP